MRKRFLVLILIIFTALAFSSCTDTLEDPFADFHYEKKEEDIDVYPVETRDFEIYDTIFAKSIPKSKVTQYFEEVSGYFKEYKVELLDEVKKGDVIAVLDSSALDKLLRDQKIVYEKEKLIFEKAQMQYQTTGGNEYAVLSAKLDFEYEEYRYNTLLKQYEALELKAEMNGIITKRYANPGALISKTSPIFDITDESEIYVSFDSKSGQGLGIGEILTIEIRNSTEIVEAEIIEINGTEIIMKPATVHSSFARTGTLIYVKILKDKRLEALVIEDNSIITEAGRVYVYVYEDGMKSERDIKIGISDRGYVEVLFGLSEGELVISNPY